jgi:hypothetical protein
MLGHGCGFSASLREEHRLSVFESGSVIGCPALFLILETVVLYVAEQKPAFKYSDWIQYSSHCLCVSCLLVQKNLQDQFTNSPRRSVRHCSSLLTWHQGLKTGVGVFFLVVTASSGHPSVMSEITWPTAFKAYKRRNITAFYLLVTWGRGSQFCRLEY